MLVSVQEVIKHNNSILKLMYTNNDLLTIISHELTVLKELLIPELLTEE